MTNLQLFFLLLTLALIQSANGDACTNSENESPYMIVIDGGSTGSRLHVFHFEHDAEQGECVCARKGSSRANVPMSAFAEVYDPQDIAAHLLPCFEFAAEVIPSEYHNTTTTRYEATAGMRLLTLGQQARVYDLLYEGLYASESFVFRGMKRSDIETLSGDLEGYYGAVAANYLSGVINANLQAGSDEQRPIGALDMGGSSTQIVYKQHESVCEPEEETCPNEDAQIQEDHFFSTSYLSYGVDQFRERLWNTLITERCAVQDYTDSCDSKIVEYPCGFQGHQIEWEGYVLVGTGDTIECARQVQRLLPHPEEATNDHHEHSGQRVGGINHPAVSGKFYAMSLYFFTLDSLRVLSHPDEQAHQQLNLNWPRPSIDELSNALDGLCSRHWKGDLEDIQHNAHQFTRAAVLPHRCFESVYMVTLLRDGFGFAPESRDIEFTFLVDGSEVEWSLGMALALRNGGGAASEEEETCGSVNTTVTTEEELLHQAARLTQQDPRIQPIVAGAGSG